MDRIILERFETSDHGTFGKIRIHEKLFYSLELPWRNNSSNFSCIPAGTYSCDFTLSARFGRRMYLVQGVNDRTGIRIHSANFAGDLTLGYKSQLNGCIALGEKYGLTGCQKGIFVSKPAISSFERIMNYKPFVLEVINAF